MFKVHQLNFASAQVSFLPLFGILEIMVLDTEVPERWVRIELTAQELARWSRLILLKESATPELPEMPELPTVPDLFELPEPPPM